MKLYLDTTNNKKVILRLSSTVIPTSPLSFRAKRSVVEESIKEFASPQDQDVLGFLMETLKLQRLPLKDITEIEVNPGPGSFTGTRVGVAIANALAFALKTKVNGQIPPVLPIYSAPPTITVR